MADTPTQIQPIVLTDCFNKIRYRIFDVGHFDVLPDSFGQILVCASGKDACERFIKENPLIASTEKDVLKMKKTLESFYKADVSVTRELYDICSLITQNAQCQVYHHKDNIDNIYIPFVRIQTDSDDTFYTFTALLQPSNGSLDDVLFYTMPAERRSEREKAFFETHQVTEDDGWLKRLAQTFGIFK